MIINNRTWFRFHYLVDITKGYLTIPQVIAQKLDDTTVVHSIVRCLPADEELKSETKAQQLAQQSIDKLREARLIKDDPAILEEFVAAIEAFRKGELKEDYDAVIRKACEEASKGGYFI